MIGESKKGQVRHFERNVKVEDTRQRSQRVKVEDNNKRKEGVKD